jgi:AcrR family transcriptional regulator
MITEMSPRKYTQKKRAAQQEETRDRIVEATMQLHEEIGASRTTVSAIAERAGVQRLTVYRHFPDEKHILEACTTRWLELHPMPQEADWDIQGGAEERLRAALRAFYTYYRRTRDMWSGAYRDIDLVPALAERMKLVDAYLDDVAGRLADTVQKRADRLVVATLRHAVEFPTWQSLSRRGLSDEDAATLVLGWMRSVRSATSAGRSSG